MSDLSLPQNTSGQPTERAPRSRTERNIVWGAIGVMAVLVALQLVARKGFLDTKTVLKLALKTARSNDTRLVHASTVASLLHGSPRLETQKYTGPFTGLGHVDTYTWRGPFMNYVLDVRYGLAGAKPKGPAGYTAIEPEVVAIDPL